MNYWLVKSEPDAYAWSQLVTDRRTAWTGVRNFQARNHLRAMKTGDPVLFYRVVCEAYPDPTAEEGDWSCVDLTPLLALAKPVSLETIKSDKLLRDMALVKQSRLSVTPLTPAQYARLLALAETRPPA
jgi:predicted RNA-binding protein with PUA-like domain